MASEDHSCRKRPRDTMTGITCTHRRRPSKPAPPADSCSTSEPSILSDASVLIPTSAPEDSTDATAAGNDSDTSSDLSESSEEPSSDSSSDDADSDAEVESERDEHHIVNLRANRGKKPCMKLRDEDLGVDLRPWLKEFLPKLKAANDELERERQAGTLKDKVIEREGDDGQYIEMDLGLGVLEERDPNAPDSSSSDSDNDEEEEDDDDNSNNNNTHGQPSKKQKDVMDKLLGRESKPVSIQEVGDGQST